MPLPIGSYVSYTLGSGEEDLYLHNPPAGMTRHINGYGNELNNIISGNDGNNYLYGGAGVDYLIGGLGDDTLDLRDPRTAYNVETADGGYGNDIFYLDKKDVAYGDEGDDVFFLFGANHSVSGGIGDDRYIISGGGASLLLEYENGGTDTVQSDGLVDISLYAEIENITLSGKNHVDAYGNDKDNEISGNGGNNILHGGNGNDILNGRIGNDTLMGEGGNDVLHLNGGDYGIDGLGIDRYEIHFDNNTVLDSSWSGADTLKIYADASHTTIHIHNPDAVVYTETDLGASAAFASNYIDGYVGKIQAMGSTGLRLQGSAADTILRGNMGNDWLHGGGGNDLLQGGMGNDTLCLGQDDASAITMGSTTMQGGGGADVFWFGRNAQGGSYADYSPNPIIISDFEVGVDTLRLALSAQDVAPTQITPKITSANWNLNRMLNEASDLGATPQRPTLAQVFDGGDTYLVLDRSTDHHFFEGGGLVIKLAGVVSGISMSSIQFDWV